VRIRFRPASAWRRLVFYWHARERGGFGFAAMGVIPVIALLSIVAFARSGRSDDETARVAAAHVRAREVRCLAENVYYEARGESLNGQYAVAEVTMNRLRAPAYPKTICGVVYDTRWDPSRRRFVGHFSWTEMEDRSDPWGPAWEQAMKVATAVYNDTYMPLVPDALHYHAIDVQPDWARSSQLVAKIGHHVFYH
jgi:spore germination cell wall hydrolase CwlJ-like protein